MKTKHTKGPWLQSHRICDEEGNYSTQVYDKEGETICTLAWYPVKTENGYTTARGANAHLISAAPELLEALQMLKKIIDDTPENGLKPIIDTYGDFREKVNNAINKALDQ